jgi:hypothetical protein
VEVVVVVAVLWDVEVEISVLLVRVVDGEVTLARACKEAETTVANSHQVMRTRNVLNIGFELEVKRV